MPILGILASSRPAVAADTGAMFPLQVITVGPAGASSVEFTNIPTTGYEHLQIRAIGRTNRVEVSGDYVKITFNADTGANYSDHYLRGDGSGTSAGANVSNSAMFASRFSDSSHTSGVFGALILDVLDYKNTNKYKTIRSLGAYDNNGDGTISFQSGSWRNTNAVTTITLVPGGGTAFAQYSQFALYGVKGAA